MNAIIKSSVLLAAMTMASTAFASERVTIKLGETVEHNGYKLTATKTGQKAVKIKKGKKDKRGMYTKMDLEFTLTNVSAEGLSVFFTGNKDPNLDTEYKVGGIDVVNAQRALNLRPGLTTGGWLLPKHRYYAYTYKDTNEEGEEVTKTKDFRIQTYFLPGDTASVNFTSWVKEGEEPEISFEIKTK